MSLRSCLRKFINILEARYDSLPWEPKSSKLAGAFLSEPARRRQDAKSSIVALDQLSSLVEDELRTLRCAQNARSVTLRIPIEILVHIFRFAGLSGVPPGWHDEEIDDESFMRQTRTAIASTCSHWREVALNDSMLWQVICLPWNSWTSTNPIYNCINLEIQRCKDTMFSFKIQAKESEMSTLAPILQSNIHRIKNLDILWMDETTIDTFRIFEESTDTTLKSLRRLCMSSVDWDHPPDGEEIHLKSASSLRELRLENEFASVDPDSLELGDSWTIYPPSSSALELIYLGGWIPAESIIDLVNSATALRSFVWSTTSAEEERELYFARLKPIPTLRNLRLGGTVPLSWLRAIQASNLDHLHLSPAYRARDSAKLIPDVVFPKLTSLTVERIHDQSALIRLLKNHPSLRVLELKSLKPTTELYSYLGSTKAEESALSNLEHLTFDYDSYKPSNVPRYLSMLEDILESRSQALPSSPPFMLHYKKHSFVSAFKIDPPVIGFLLQKYAGMFDTITSTGSTAWEWPCW